MGNSGRRRHSITRGDLGKRGLELKLMWEKYLCNIVYFL